MNCSCEIDSAHGTEEKLIPFQALNIIYWCICSGVSEVSLHGIMADLLKLSLDKYVDTQYIIPECAKSMQLYVSLLITMS